MLKEIYQSFPLDVSNGNPQQENFNFKFPENFIPGTRQCSIFGYSKFCYMPDYLQQGNIYCECAFCFKTCT